MKQVIYFQKYRNFKSFNIYPNNNFKIKKMIYSIALDFLKHFSTTL